jgi:hypothetical protein
VIFKTQTMQQRDQSQTAFVDQPELFLDPGADVARRTRQRRADKVFQCVFLRDAQKARAPAHVETGQAFDPALLEEFAPVANCVVVEKQGICDFPTASPVVEQHKRVGPPRHARRSRALARQRDQFCAILFAKEAGSFHAAIRIRPEKHCKKFFPGSSMSRSIHAILLVYRQLRLFLVS